MNKKQKKQFDMYVKKLGIKTEGEKYVLEHILKRDWGRDIILLNISKIAKNHSRLVDVRCRTKGGLYSFSVSHLEDKNLITDIEKQKAYINKDLYYKIGY